MKISFIATVLNEEEEIEEFLYSLLTQSKKPTEIIIVDAGSIDKTREYIKKNKLIKLIVKKGNRSTGRNFAIKKATGDIIVVSDVGCILDKNFIKNITDPFKKNKIDVVSGFYYPIVNNVFEKSLAAYTCIMVDKIDKKNYLPSSRSIAFKKSTWSKIGGYPEELDTCEDLIFAIRLKHIGMKFIFIKKAYVHWRQQKNIALAWKQFYSYAVGDGQALYIRPQTPILYLRYLLGIIFFLLYLFTSSNLVLIMLIVTISFYFLWSILKSYHYVMHPLALIFLPVLQFTADTAVMSGMVAGVLKRYYK